MHSILKNHQPLVTMDTAPAEVKHWLKTFARAVREEDYDTGRKLFDPGVVSFGTVCGRAEGLDRLVEEQWRIIWSSTEGFDFDYATALGTSDARTATAIATWSSRRQDEKRQPITRRGRATIILRRTDHGLKAIHSHFSMAPGS